MSNSDYHQFYDDKKQLKKWINQGIIKVLDPENFKNWLYISSKRLDDLPFYNSFIVWLQRPDATRVMDAELWNKLGYNVKEDAKGITIFQPVYISEDTVQNICRKISDILESRLEENPRREKVHYRFSGLNLEIDLNRNGEYHLFVGDGRQYVGLKKDLNRIIKDNILNKPVIYAEETVYAAEDTICMIPMTQAGYHQLPENRGIIQSDPARIAILYDILKEMSRRNGAYVYEIDRSNDSILKDGVDGYFLQGSDIKGSRGYLVVSADLDPLKAVSVMLQQMPHGDIYERIKKLAERVGESNLPLHFREIQTEAVAFVAGRNLGIETEVGSFQYLSKDADRVNPQVFSQWLEVVHDGCIQFTRELAAELALRGFNMDLSERGDEPVEKIDFLALVKSYEAHLSGYYKGDYFKKELKDYVEKIKESIMNNPMTLQNQRDFKAILEGMREKSKMQEIKFAYKADPVATIESMKKDYPKLRQLTEAQIRYLAESKFVEREILPLLGDSFTPEQFVYVACERAAQFANAVSGKKIIIEITSCDQPMDKPILIGGDLMDPRKLDMIIQQLEAQLRRLNAKGELGDNFLCARCDMMIYLVDQGHIVKTLNTCIDIGDGKQSSLIDHLRKISGEQDMVKEVEKAISEFRKPRNPEQQNPKDKTGR